MALNFGWNWRGTVGPPPTDALSDVVDYGAATYPTTFTNGNGQTISAGWVTDQPLFLVGDSSVDARLAGQAYCNGVTRTFRINLASGSGGGAGTYRMRLAAGYVGGSAYVRLLIQDSTTTITSGTRPRPVVQAPHAVLGEPPPQPADLHDGVAGAFRDRHAGHALRPSATPPGAAA